MKARGIFLSKEFHSEWTEPDRQMLVPRAMLLMVVRQGWRLAEHMSMWEGMGVRVFATRRQKAGREEWLVWRFKAQ
jgi:hypothetical protein